MAGHAAPLSTALPLGRPAVDYKDYYKTLGVAKDAGADEIKKAFRKLARKYHPDVSKEADAQQRMAEVNEAYNVLSDPEKRKAYDELGDPSQYQGAQGQGFTPPPGWNHQEFHFRDSDGASGMGGMHGEDYSSFFEELFGRAHRQQRRQRQQAGPPPDVRGRDRHSVIELDVPDSYAGGMHRLQLRGVQLDAQGHAHETVRELQVTIPKGVREGQMIRLAGQGSPGLGNGEAGDLLLEVRFRADKRWHTEGKDVYQQLPLMPWEAALGGPVEFTTLAGPLEINVPAGSQPGRKLRIKGKGLPSSTPGDLYLVLQLQVPKAHTAAQRAAYEALAAAYADLRTRTGDAT
jgi:curved DNA-binding protein